MKKIPVLDTIRFAYGFTFGHLGTIIGLIWLPMVIVTVGGYFVAANYYTVFPAALAAGNPAAIGKPVLIMLVWVLVSMVFYAMMYSAVVKQVLGLRQGPAMIYFNFGSAELRVFAALLGMIAVMFLLLLLEAVVFGIAAGTAGTLAKGAPAAKLGLALLGLAMLFVLVYVSVRLSFLLVPASVAEDRVGLGQGWELTGGNFWRIVAIGLATLLPFFLVTVAAEVAIIGPAFFLHHMAAAPAHDAAARMQQSVEQMREMSKHLPVLSALGFLLAPLATGLTMAPAAFAYRALTGRDGGGIAL